MKEKSNAIPYMPFAKSDEEKESERATSIIIIIIKIFI